MFSRIVRIALIAVGIATMSSAPAWATPAPPPEPPPPEGEPSLIPVPAGCNVPEPADVAFVGTVLDKDGFIQKGTVRFRIDQIRAGDAGPFAVDGLIDVRYGPDSKYLEIDQDYLVAASVDPEIGVLSSKVSPDTPLFGGDAVIGLEDTEVECPELDDPVQTLNTDGTTVDSGLLSPLFEDKRLLLATIGVPAGIVAAALLGLVLLRRAGELGVRGIFTLGRQAVTAKPDHAAARVRQHRTLSEDAALHGDDHPDDDLVASGTARRPWRL